MLGQSYAQPVLCSAIKMFNVTFSLLKLKIVVLVSKLGPNVMKVVVLDLSLHPLTLQFYTNIYIIQVLAILTYILSIHW